MCIYTFSSFCIMYCIFTCTWYKMRWIIYFDSSLLIRINQWQNRLNQLWTPRCEFFAQQRGQLFVTFKKKGFYLSLPWHGQGFSVSASEFQFAVLYKRLVHLYDWSFNTDILKKHTKASVVFFGVLILCRGPVQSSFLTIPHGVNLNAAKVLAVFQSHVGLLHLHGKW